MKNLFKPIQKSFSLFCFSSLLLFMCIGIGHFSRVDTCARADFMSENFLGSCLIAFLTFSRTCQTPKGTEYPS